MQSANRIPATSVQLSLYPALEWLLRASVALVLLGRAWQHLRYNTPLTALVWSPELFGGIARTWFGMEWHAWSTSSAVLGAIQAIERGLGALYLTGAVVALLPLATVRARRTQLVVLVSSSLGLVVLAGLNYLDNKRHFAQPLELAIQCSLPAILALVLRGRGELTALHQWWLRLAIAATFAGHGMYAIGYYEVPGQFVTMVMRSLHVSESAALELLKIAGCLDFAVALGALTASRLGRLGVVTLVYAAGWGTLTALARLWAFFRWDLAFERVAQWLHETVMRLPHGLVPLLLVLVFWQRARLPEPQMGEGG